MASKKKFLNPFGKGVTYEKFLKAIPINTTIKQYCKGKLSDNEISWIETEINNYKNN